MSHFLSDLDSWIWCSIPLTLQMEAFVKANYLLTARELHQGVLATPPPQFDAFASDSAKMNFWWSHQSQTRARNFDSKSNASDSKGLAMWYETTRGPDLNESKNNLNYALIETVRHLLPAESCSHIMLLLWVVAVSCCENTTKRRVRSSKRNSSYYCSEWPATDSDWFLNLMKWSILRRSCCIWLHLPMWLTFWRRVYVCQRRSARQPRVSKWWLGLKILLFRICIVDTRRVPEPRIWQDMQCRDDIPPFFGLIASTVTRSQLRKELESRSIVSWSKQLWGGRSGVISIL